MTSRRNFMALSVAAAAATLMPVTNAEASKSPKFPSNIVYTQKDPGVWDKKVGSHLPQVEVKGDQAVVQTLHPMTEKHYIVRHTLVDEGGNVVGAKTFSNTDKKAISRFKLPADSKGKTFYATSFCNKHDFWVNKVKL